MTRSSLASHFLVAVDFRLLGRSMRSGNQFRRFRRPVAGNKYKRARALLNPLILSTMPQFDCRFVSLADADDMTSQYFRN